MKNKFKSLITLLIMLMIATMTVGGKIQLNNVFQVAVTVLMYIGVFKFSVFTFKLIQNVYNEVENLIYGKKKKYN